MTILRLTAIRCLCRDRGLERVKDSVVLKKVYGCGVNGNTLVSKTKVQSSNLYTYANYGVQHSLVVRCVWDAKVRGSNPRTPTNLKLLPVELALGLRNRVANVRFIPRVPLYGVCSITGNAQGCEPCRCGIEARHTPQTQEDCQSGRSELLAKESNRKVPWVRIPHLPPNNRDIAQLVEHLTLTQSVLGSIPSIPSICIVSVAKRLMRRIANP